MREKINTIDAALSEIFEESDLSIYQAAHYTLLPEGKRYRGLLTLAIYEALGGCEKQFIKCTVGIECIHAASLIFDDLPCMDNAPLRKGKSSTHIAYGEDIAILAGLLLQEKGKNLIQQNAFDNKLGTAKLEKIVKLLEVTTTGIYEGQELDLKQTKSEEELIHCMTKKNSLFYLACVLPAHFFSLPDKTRSSLCNAGQKLSLAYQLFDDLRDATESLEIAGKPVGVDKDKQTLVYRHGVEWSQSFLGEIMSEVENEFRKIGINAVFDHLIKGLIFNPPQ